jgi:molybdopterin-dependent oxidoreductase alpha subunit
VPPKPSIWASWKPFGIGEQRPNNYLEIARAVAENRDELPYAMRILREGVCDGCSLGTAGLRDWTLDGIHVCNVRLRLLRLNTMSALDPTVLADVAALRERSGRELRELGRLPYPLVRARREAGFRRASWDEALDLIATRIRAAGPDRTAFYMTNRGMPNEAYYAAQKAARAIGTNSIDTAARVCHSPSTFGLKGTIGVASTTCSYSDWIDSDLVVFAGSNVANNQPVAMKYLHHAKKAGTRVAVVNPYREPGMERYWVPSAPESALFGTRIADRFFLVDTGGDLAFLSGVLKHMVERGWVDEDFVAAHTTGFDELRAELDAMEWGRLGQAAGASSDDMLGLARMLAEADRAVFVWSMGITQHEGGEDNVRAIVNLALSKGFVGRTGCGLMPIRGHSGVQGGAEMGCFSTNFPGGAPVDAQHAAELGEEWGFEVPSEPGLTAPEMIDAAHAGELDVLFSAGGNFLDVLPDPGFSAVALERVPLRVHMDLVVSSQMVLDPAETVVLLPAATRYETPGGVTETSTERRVIFSPEVRGRRIAEARPEWDVFLDLARRTRPDLADRLRAPDTAAVRDEIARVVPFYRGIEKLSRQGDQFQYGGAHLCADWRFPTPDGRASFSPLRLPPPRQRDGRFTVSTRRGKQFNSMVQSSRDAITGARRDSVLVCAADAERVGVADGDPVVLRTDHGELRGRALLAELRPGNLQVHWPEGNVLLPREVRSREAGIPDYNARATLERDDG